MEFVNCYLEFVDFYSLIILDLHSEYLWDTDDRGCTLYVGH